MKKIILTTVMVLTLLYLGLINISYAKDLEKGISEEAGIEKAYDNLPINVEERKIEKEADDSYENDREDDEVANDNDEKVEVDLEEQNEEN
jgi:hypothetical protein